VIPLVGFVAVWAFLVLWIIYWVRIANYSRQLTMLPGAMPPAGI